MGGVPDLGQSFLGGASLGRQMAMDRFNQQQAQQQFEIQQLAMQRADALARMKIEHDLAGMANDRAKIQNERDRFGFDQEKFRQEEARRASDQGFKQFRGAFAPMTGNKIAQDYHGDQVAAIDAKWPEYKAAPEVPQGVPSRLARPATTQAEPANPLASPWAGIGQGEQAKAGMDAADASIWANSKPAIQGQLGQMNAKLGQDVATTSRGLLDAKLNAKTDVADLGTERIKQRDLVEARKFFDANNAFRNAFGQNALTIMRANRIFPLIDSGQATPEQFSEIPMAAAAMIQGSNVAHQEAIRSITPKSWPMDVARWKQYFLNKPVDAEMQAFAQNFRKLIEREKAVGENSIRAIQEERLPGFYDAFVRNPAGMAALVRGYGITPDQYNLDTGDAVAFGTRKANKWPGAGGSGGVTANKIRVKDKATGQTGRIPENEFDAAKYERIK